MTPTAFNLAGHSVEFADCREAGQGGPITCSMSIDGQAVARRRPWRSSRPFRFHPSPLAVEGDILVPLWEATRFYLVRIDPLVLKPRRLSSGFGYMRLLRVEADEVEFSTRWDDGQTKTVRIT